MEISGPQVEPQEETQVTPGSWSDYRAGGCLSRTNGTSGPEAESQEEGARASKPQEEEAQPDCSIQPGYNAGSSPGHTNGTNGPEAESQEDGGSIITRRPVTPELRTARLAAARPADC